MPNTFMAVALDTNDAENGLSLPTNINYNGGQPTDQGRREIIPTDPLLGIPSKV